MLHFLDQNGNFLAGVDFEYRGCVQHGAGLSQQNAQNYHYFRCFADNFVQKRGYTAAKV